MHKDSESPKLQNQRENREFFCCFDEFIELKIRRTELYFWVISKNCSNRQPLAQKLDCNCEFKKNIKLKFAIRARMHWLRSWRIFFNVQKPVVEKISWLEWYLLARSTDSMALQRGLNDCGDAMQITERKGRRKWGKISPNLNKKSVYGYEGWK